MSSPLKVSKVPCLLLVRIAGVTGAGTRYGTSRSFHLCVPAKAAGPPAGQYLKRL